MPLNYYNEIDPFAAQWLRNLIDAELIPYGIVDTRDIRNVQPSDLAGFTQCHFFAGIGGWSYALSLAGVPASVPLWTGSCPCQPFSAAGKRAGVRYSTGPWIAGVNPDTIKIRPRGFNFPAEFRAAFVIENNSDSRTDYFEKDCIRIVPGHPLYAAIKAVA